MKAIILSALTAATLAVSAAAQDYGSLILNHQIAVGMTYEGVVAALGEPQRVVRTSPGAIDYWTMKNRCVVVFQNGKVTRIYSKAEAVEACLVEANAAESE